MSVGKREMKKLRNYIRKNLRNIQSDDYLVSVSKNLEVRIINWKDYSALVVVRDKTKPETDWNSEFCHYQIIHTYSNTYFGLWNMINEVLSNMLREEQKKISK